MSTQPREIEWLAQSHTAGLQQCWDHSPGSEPYVETLHLAPLLVDKRAGGDATRSCIVPGDDDPTPSSRFALIGLQKLLFPLLLVGSRKTV